MKNRIYILLASPLFFAFTCNTTILGLVRDTQMTTEISHLNNQVYLKVYASFDAYAMQKKRIDSVQYIFSDQTEKTIGVVSQPTVGYKSKERLAVEKQLPLNDFLGNDILELRVTAKIFRKAKYLQSEYLQIAEYDLTQYK